MSGVGSPRERSARISLKRIADGAEDFGGIAQQASSGGQAGHGVGMVLEVRRIRDGPRRDPFSLGRGGGRA